MKSLRLKILIPVIILSLFATVTISLGGYFFASSIIIKQVEQLAASKVDKLVAVVDQKINTARAEIEILASTDTIRRMNWDEIRLYLERQSGTLNNIDMFFLADKNGNAFSSRRGKLNITDRENIFESDYFTKAMGGQTIVSEPMISQATGTPVIKIASPVKGQNHNVIGVFGGIIELDRLSNIINTEKLGNDGYSFMIGKDGLVYAHRDKAVVMKENILKPKDKKLTSESLTGIIQSMIKGHSEIGYYDLEGGKHLIAYAPLKSTGWSIAVNAAYSEATKEIGDYIRGGLVIGIISVLLMIIMTSLIIRHSLKPVKIMTNITKEVASGNLKARIDVKTKDEIGLLANNFNNMIEKMKALISDMKEAGMTVSSSAQQMQASSNEAGKVAEQVAVTISELAKAASEQSQSAQEGSELVKGVVAGLNRITGNTVNAELLTGKAMETVDAGFRSMELQKEKMARSKLVSLNVSAAISQLSEKSAKIGQIIEAINSIAEQTNLLALNAAIEAARAGEAGKGFAVVADEIRKLAEQSKLSSREISSLTFQIKKGIENAVAEMNSADEVVMEQETAVNETVKAFENIMKAFEDVTKQIKEIAMSAEVLDKQASSAENSINNIACIVEENAAATEEVAASTEEQIASIQQIAASAEHLSALSSKLQKSMEQFKI